MKKEKKERYLRDFYAVPQFIKRLGYMIVQGGVFHSEDACKKA